MLSAADIFLAPYEDGISTRRTTLMAALQHGIPVVATLGPLTDRLLREAGSRLDLVPVEDRAAFAERVSRLAQDPERRKALGAAGRTFYEEQFAWPVVSRRLREVLDERAASR
jgi:glycosyltransferase involved in cell wall biosynthesis